MAEQPLQLRQRRGWRDVVPAPLRHGVTVFAALLVIEYFVIPRFIVARQSVSLFDQLNYGWFAAAVVAEAFAFITYAQLTKTLLPTSSPSLSTVLRIDLAGTAIAHVLPGGSAGSAGLGYRLLTARGVTGRDAGFAMATQSIGSTVILNVMLWCALVISIPIAGFNPIYVTVALLGMFALLGFAGLVFALTLGEEHAARFARAIGRKLPPLDEERLDQLVRHMGASLRALAADRARLRAVAIWATLNWICDAASLWAFVFAFGATISPIFLFVAYGIANVLAAVPITPGGLGLVETSATAILTGFGVQRGIGTLAVLSWRLFNFWMPIPIGAATYVSLKVRRGAGFRVRRNALTNMAVDAVEAEADAVAAEADALDIDPPEAGAPGPPLDLG